MDKFCAFISFEQREKLAELTIYSYFDTKLTVNILYTSYNKKILDESIIKGEQDND